ncbi:hypothetical protein [Mucilaginibacter sp.]|uniref:hypothetical protein n=1 Tax=Mucilaginibacter sp. TaxID=1882438 RepID=UPI00263447BE|nr:hypothetical protein [Mucilaginibacter sp.]
MQNPVSNEELKVIGFKIPEALADYNRKAIQTAQFIQPAIDKYITNFYLNADQVSKLQAIKTELQQNPVFEQIVAAIEETKVVMTPVLKTKVTASGFMGDASYSFYVHEEFNKVVNHFGNLEELELVLYEIPYPVISRYTYEPVKISPDGKKLTVTVAQNRYYNNKGVATGKPLPYEVLTSVAHHLADAAKAYKDWVQKKQTKDTETI